MGLQKQNSNKANGMNITTTILKQCAIQLSKTTLSLIFFFVKSRNHKVYFITSDAFV